MNARNQLTTVLMGGVLTLASALNSNAQLQFTGIKASDETAIKLNWNSQSNAVYRIEFLADLNDSSNAWTTLYGDYPSHGTNTFWLDTGDYSRTPYVLHPKNTTNRFYRMVKVATNALPAPVVTIVSPSASSVLSNEVTISVSVSSTNSLYSLRLFVDGQEMNPSEDDGTNWVINTTEWPNGQHVIFAAARVVDRIPEKASNPASKYAWGVSSRVPVTFNNFISRVSFSEPYFEPDLGQTQRVTAAFGSYADWTLQIVDEFDTPVRTVTGSGTSLTYDWDGTGDGDVWIPPGVYYYLISAEEGQQLNAMMSPEESTTANKSSVLNKIDAGDGYDWVEIKLPPLPWPLQKTDEPQSYWVKRPKVVEKPLSEQSRYLNGYQPVENSSFGSLAAVAAPPTKTPKRPPTEPVKGYVGTFGIVAYDYSTTTTNSNPTDPFGPVEVENIYGLFVSSRIPDAKIFGDSFSKVMKKTAYKQVFNKSGKDTTALELKRNNYGIGGGNLFNQVNIGLFLAHGNYGTELDFSNGTGVSLQTYFHIDGPSNSTNQWIRLSEFEFGGDMRWMFLLACDGLRNENYSSMHSKNALPLTETSHLICGATTVLGFTEYLGENIAKELKAKKTIPRAWYDAGKKTYGEVKAGGITNTYIFRVSGWTSCFSDRINAWNDPDTLSDTIDETTEQVYP